MEKEILDIINNEEKISFVAEENEKILGIIVLKIKEVINHINLKNSKVLWIEELCVDENNRGKGIGKILINNAKEIAKDLKCERLELNCWEANKDAITFYEKQGMKSQRRIMEIKI
ncbi:MAG: GNAT family N-acetyltransferase [Clostridia bacterium]